MITNSGPVNRSTDRDSQPPKRRWSLGGPGNRRQPRSRHQYQEAVRAGSGRAGKTKPGRVRGPGAGHARSATTVTRVLAAVPPDFAARCLRSNRSTQFEHGSQRPARWPYSSWAHHPAEGLVCLIVADGRTGSAHSCTRCCSGGSPKVGPLWWAMSRFRP
jgi:hypothetical protein